MKKSFRILITFIILTIVVSIFVGCQNEGSSDNAIGEDPIRLKMNHTVAETSSWHIYSERFAELVKERTNGRYVIDVFANEQLASGSQQKTLEMLRAGTIDLDIHSTTIWSGIDSRFSIVLMPWLLPTFDDVDNFLTGEVGEKFLELVTENGCVPIALGENGHRQVLNTKRPIKSPDDVKNLKIRVPGLTLYVDMYRALGADATNLNWGEVFTAIQQGTIDGMESPPEIIMSGKFYEVNEHMTMWNISYDPIILSMSQKLKDNLSKEDFEIIVKCGKQAMQEQTEYQRIQNEKDAKGLEEFIEVYYPTEGEIEAFQEAVAPIYEQYSDEFPDDLKEAFGYNY